MVCVGWFLNLPCVSAKSFILKMRWNWNIKTQKGLRLFLGVLAYMYYVICMISNIYYSITAGIFNEFHVHFVVNYEICK